MCGHTWAVASKRDVRGLTRSMHACEGPALEGRPRGVARRLCQAAPVVHGIRAWPGNDLRCTRHGPSCQA